MLGEQGGTEPGECGGWEGSCGGSGEVSEVGGATSYETSSTGDAKGFPDKGVT